jgi:hypothetical protein
MVWISLCLMQLHQARLRFLRRPKCVSNAQRMVCQPIATVSLGKFARVYPGSNVLCTENKDAVTKSGSTERFQQGNMHEQ